MKTSTGYGFVKGRTAKYNYEGATEHDLALMRAHASPKVQVKAAGGVRDLDALIRVRDLGDDALRRHRHRGDARRVPQARRGGGRGGASGPKSGGKVGGGGY